MTPRPRRRRGGALVWLPLWAAWVAVPSSSASSSLAHADLEVVAVVDAAVAPAIVAEVERVWSELVALVPSTQPTMPPPPTSSSRFRLTVRPAFALPASMLARSSPGTIEVRLSAVAALDASTRLALRHEVVHQFLWRRCGPSTHDRLFHEAIAVALSGEAPMWREGGYHSIAVAAQTLQSTELDTPRARRALARLVSEGGQGLPASLSTRLSRCADDAPWVPLDVDELAGGAIQAAHDALVVLHTQTGEVLEQSGAATVPQPYGSTLKPFIVAAAVAAGRPLPVLTAAPSDPQWACGEGMPAELDVAGALQRSCNGWFLGLEAHQGHAAVDLGALGEVLVRLGLSRLPADMSEAIGVRTGPTIGARALAEAYRLLALTTPAARDVDVIRALSTRGTLVGAAGIEGLRGMAAKTGTVRDHASRPTHGLLVAVDDQLVIVRIRAGVQARALVSDVVAARRRHQGRRHEKRNVQVFGLMPEQNIDVRCDGTAVTIDAIPRLASSTTLSSLLSRGRAVCAGGPWRVSAGRALAERPYAGVFVRSVAPPFSSSDETATPRQRAARRGSDVLFVTSRLRYTAGVLQAEDAAIRGEARVALARVIDHDLDFGHERHSGRPVCDTTHCMTFLGTPPDTPDAAVVAALSRPLSAAGLSGWLPFSQGGESPWEQTRSHDDVVAAVGAFTMLLAKEPGVGEAPSVLVVRQETEGDADVDVTERLPCERLWSPLRLPSCPTRIERHAETWRFVGRGAGHGLGLDVEAAKAQARAGASVDAILERAFPARHKTIAKKTAPSQPDRQRVGATSTTSGR